MHPTVVVPRDNISSTLCLILLPALFPLFHSHKSCMVLDSSARSKYATRKAERLYTSWPVYYRPHVVLAYMCVMLSTSLVFSVLVYHHSNAPTYVVKELLPVEVVMSSTTNHVLDYFTHTREFTLIDITNSSH